MLCVPGKEKEEDMKQKQRKRGIRRMFAGAMAVLMMLSAADVSGWGVMNAKAAALIIDDFRSGKLGHITLERPEI